MHWAILPGFVRIVFEIRIFKLIISLISAYVIKKNLHFPFSEIVVLELPPACPALRDGLTTEYRVTF